MGQKRSRLADVSSNEELYDKYEEKFGEIPILHAWGVFIR